MKRISTIVLATLAGVMALSAQPKTVNGRRENQQDRVAQGVRSGQLTARETAGIEKRESAINQEVRTDRALNGGKLTSQERQTVNRQQNRMSNQIYKDKHNAAQATYGKNQVGARRENQQDRIANGIQSGKLSAAETARLEKHEGAINREVKTDRSLNGGKLTPGEKRIVNGQQNQVSGQIYKDKHN